MRWLTGVVLAASGLWAVALLAVPVVVARGAPSAPAAVAAAAAYLAGGAVCHQRPERTLRVAGQPMPVCARCAGLYLAFPAALLFCLRAPSGARLRRWLALCAAPTVVSVAFELATGYTSAPLRVAAGALLALGLARIVAAALAAGAARPATPVLLH